MSAPPRPAKPPVSVVDLVVSIIAIVLTAAFGIVGAAMGVADSSRHSE